MIWWNRKDGCSILVPSNLHFDKFDVAWVWFDVEGRLQDRRCWRIWMIWIEDGGFNFWKSGGRWLWVVYTSFLVISPQFGLRCPKNSAQRWCTIGGLEYRKMRATLISSLQKHGLFVSFCHGQFSSNLHPFFRLPSICKRLRAHVCWVVRALLWSKAHGNSWRLAWDYLALHPGWLVEGG